MADNVFSHGVAFVIPALNEELLIGRCIKSIRAEMLRSPHIATQIIVVDNGSTDATAAVAMVNGAFVISERKRGIVNAKQAGFDRSRYPIVAFIDADCMLRSGWLDRAVSAFDDPNVVAVSGPYNYYDTRIGKHLAKPIFFMMGLLSHIAPMMMGGNSVVRRSSIEKIGGLDTSFTFYGEDTKTACDLAKIGRVRFDSKLIVDSSGRRLQDQGYLRTLFAYLINTVSVRLTQRAATTEHQDYR